VQLPEVQVLAFVQQVLQEGAQRIELQGGQGAFGHHWISLTNGATGTQR